MVKTRNSAQNDPNNSSGFHTYGEKENGMVINRYQQNYEDNNDASGINLEEIKS